jgi:hypothetical protein
MWLDESPIAVWRRSENHLPRGRMRDSSTASTRAAGVRHVSAAGFLANLP